MRQTSLGANAAVGNQGLEVWKGGGNAGRGYGLGSFEALGDGQVHLEKLGQPVSIGREAVGSEDGGVQSGVGVFEGVRFSL